MKIVGVYSSLLNKLDLWLATMNLPDGEVGQKYFCLFWQTVLEIR